MKLYKSILISIATIVLASCSSVTNLAESSSIPTPEVGIEIQSGKYLEVTAPDAWNSFKTDDPISLVVRNISKNQIASGPDFGARIFLLTNDRWIEVKNKMVYETDPFILDPGENYDPLKMSATSILPDLPDYLVTSCIRIFVIGVLIENGKESKKVASYIDLTLNP